MTKVQSARDRYIRQVGQYFRDVPWTTRQTILADLTAHLDEANLADNTWEAWTEHFGRPYEYARQLRKDLGYATALDSIAKAQRFNARHVRPRTKALIAATVLLISAAAGSTIWVANYQPLRIGAITTCCAKSLSAGGATEYQFTWVQDGEFYIGIWITNTGSVAIRVTDIGPQAGLSMSNPNLPWDNWRITLSTKEIPRPEGNDRPFSPFELAPGATQLIYIRADFDNCRPRFVAGGGAGLNSIHVSFEVAGFDRAEHLQLGFTYSVVEIDCPN
jgi:hypothetical protein